MFEPEDVHSLSESEQSLREVIRRREQLVSQRVQEKNRLEKGLRGMARESTERHIEWLDEEIERLEAARGALLRSDAELMERAKLYGSVLGVGEHTAGVLLTHLPELGRCSGKSLTALVGLAPWSKDSGRKRGHRVIRRRSWSGEASAVHVGAVGCASRRSGTIVLRAVEEQGEAVQSGVGGGDAEDAAPVERSCAAWDPLGRKLRPCVLKTLDSKHRYSCGSRNPMALR